MENNPQVSVICLCYNHAQFVVETLQSVVNQTHKNIQILIVDDCSNDNSVEVIENWLINFPEIKFIKNEKNIGNTKTFNSVLPLATGDYLMDLAADDVLELDCFENLISKFNDSSFENLGAVFGNCILIDEKSTKTDYFFEVDSDERIQQKPKTGNVYETILSGGATSMCTVSTLFKREVYKNLKGYNTDLAYEDLDFWIRASRKYNFDFVDKIVIKKRVLKTSLGTHFHKKSSKLSRKINNSTLEILKNVYYLNVSKNEDKAIMKRLHFEIILNWKTNNFMLISKLLLLKLKFQKRMFFNLYKV